MVPTSKPRVKEMVEVRDSLKWNEVYKVTDLDPRERCPQLPLPDIHIVLIASACHSKNYASLPYPPKTRLAGIREGSRLLSTSTSTPSPEEKSIFSVCN